MCTGHKVRDNRFDVHSIQVYVAHIIFINNMNLNFLSISRCDKITFNCVLCHITSKNSLLAYKTGI